MAINADNISVLRHVVFVVFQPQRACLIFSLHFFIPIQLERKQAGKYQGINNKKNCECNCIET
jgi:hypothetical protein